MAHFAKLDENNVVITVVVVDNINLLNEDGVEEEAVGIAYLNNIFNDGSTWVQTSHSGSKRKLFAATGYTYNEAKDVFIAPAPYDSWTLNEDTCEWEPPVACPTEDIAPRTYHWIEETQVWEIDET